MQSLPTNVLVTQYVENCVLFLVGPSAKPYPSLENDEDCIRLVALGKDGLASAKEHHSASWAAGRKKGLRVKRTVQLRQDRLTAWLLNHIPAPEQQ
jgi:hypothetical protein